MIDPLWGTFNHALPPHPNGDFMTSPLRLDGAAGAPLPGDIGVRGSLSSELKGLADLFVAGNLSPAEYEMCKAAVMARFHKLDAARAAASGIAATPEDERFSRTQAQLASQGVLTAARPHSASPSPEADDQGYEVSTEASPARAATAGFTLLVCAGVYGQKVNLEVEFEQCPAVADVHAKATQLFKAEVAAAKQPDHPFLDVRFIRLQV
ncbi:calmodulin-like protein containing EF hand domain, partial [Diplonema papillatum]